MRGIRIPHPDKTGRLAAFAAVIGALLVLSGCATAPTTTASGRVDPAVAAMYSAVETEPFRVPAVKVQKIDPQYYRQIVQTPPNVTQQPGTIVVDPQNKFLYLVQAGGTSMRYGIGVGRQGFAWSGDAQIKDKQEWPKWFPPAEMMARDPYAAQFPDGMEGGLKNPLGARALYLYQGDKDTLYRLHGTNEQDSIGKAVSSGCIRLLNQDIIDLYQRVPLGTRVVVLGGPGMVPPLDAAYPPIEVGQLNASPTF
jgi:lipoprotein-anchoring transpeptidase ErfK/SrfK